MRTNVIREKDVVKQVFEKLKETIKNAYVPYSKYPVACVIESGDGYFQGVNVESASYPVTLCAERNAIGSMIACGLSKKIKTVYLYTETENYSAPCGMCRQAISEFANDETSVYIFNKNEEILICPFSDLFPNSFSKDHVLEKNDTNNK